MPDVTRQLAEFVADYPAGITSPAAHDAIRRAVLDLLGVIVRGADEPAGQRSLAYARTQAAPGRSAVLGGGVRLSPSLAALVNGTAGHALDYDDIGVGAGHVSVAILPAVLAVGEDIGADGGAFCDAAILGYEVAHRLTRMYSDTRLGPYAAGYHKPSVYSLFGAAAAVARLLGLDATGVANALGIAASQAGGLRINFGTMTKPLHAGLANRSGIEAALLAAAGFTGHVQALEGRFGWHDVICRGEGDLDLVIEGLGRSFAIEEGLWFKNYPSCGANHYAIDGLIRLMNEEQLDERDVAEVEVAIDATYLNDVLVYEWPDHPLEGKFCLAYNVAAALVDRAVTIETFTAPAVTRLGPSRDRIRVRPRTGGPQNGAEVRVHMTDGRVFQREQSVLRGSLDDPMSWDELVAKFLANTAQLPQVASMLGVVEAVRSLGPATMLSDITEPLLGV